MCTDIILTIRMKQKASAPWERPLHHIPWERPLHDILLEETVEVEQSVAAVHDLSSLAFEDIVADPGDSGQEDRQKRTVGRDIVM